MSRSIANSASMRATASIAIGALLRRATSKNFRRACDLSRALDKAHYLERDFIWSRRRYLQQPAMTAARQTPHKNRTQSERLEEGEEVRLGLPRLGVCWPYP